MESVSDIENVEFKDLARLTEHLINGRIVITTRDIQGLRRIGTRSTRRRILVLSGMLQDVASVEIDAMNSQSFILNAQTSGFACDGCPYILLGASDFPNCEAAWAGAKSSGQSGYSIIAHG